MYLTLIQIPITKSNAVVYHTITLILYMRENHFSPSPCNMYYIIVLTDHFVLSIKWISMSFIKTEPFQATAVPATVIFPCWNTVFDGRWAGLYLLPRTLRREEASWGHSVVALLIRSGLSVEPCTFDTVTADRHDLLIYCTVNNRPSRIIFTLCIPLVKHIT